MIVQSGPSLADLAPGDAAHEAYRRIILSLPAVDTFELCRYSTPPPLQERIPFGARENALLDRAMEKRKEGVPFWQALLAAVLELGWCSGEIVDAVIFHNGPGSIESIPFSVLRQGSLSALIKRLDGNVGLSSRLKTLNGETLHLAFLDFRCEVSSGNREILEIVCERLYAGGFVLAESGNSYHACGIRPLTDAQRIEFLAKAILLSPIVDAAYTAHQLRQAFSTIRISNRGADDMFPRIISIRS